MVQSDRDDQGFYTGPGETSITLTTAIARQGAEPLTVITLKEPTAKQLSQFFEKVNNTNDEGVAAMGLLISLCSGIIPTDIDQLRQRDFDRCGAWFALFTKAAPRVQTTA